MDKIKSIFNHPRKEEPKKEKGLYDWSKPAFKKDDVGQLIRFLTVFSKYLENSESFKKNI